VTRREEAQAEPARECMGLCAIHRARMGRDKRDCSECERAL
jgi:hypothetical protein